MGRSEWVHRAVLTVGGFLAAWAYAWLSDREPNPVLLGFAVLAVAALLAAGWDTLEPGAGVDWLISPRYAAGVRGFDPRFSRLAQDIAESTDRQAVASEVHQVLGRVADDLLRSKYGVDPDGRPEAARGILGDPLADYLAAPPRYPRRGFDRQINGLLDRLEEL